MPRIGFLFVAFLMSTCALAAEDNALKRSFNIAYDAFKNALESEDIELTIRTGLNAYNTGKRLFGSNSVNTANLASNLATAYIDNKEFKLANELLLPYIDVYLEEYKEDSLAIVDLYILVAKSYQRKSKNKQIKYYQKALSLLDSHKDSKPLLVAKTQADIGAELLSLGSPKSRVLIEANDYLSKHLPANERQLVYSNYYTGNYYIATGKTDKAIAMLSKNLDVFYNLDGPTHPLELTTHAVLVKAYEKIGESDQATNHCKAIGQMTPWDDNQLPKPLYRTQPQYPQSAVRSRKDGYAIVEFVIDANGFVKDPISTEYGGSKKFQRAPIDAVENWRYAPKFENGEPVEATSRVQLDFKIGR
ncbi:TonB family protein [Psychrosphaera sp. B3R10]|uniref:TonB family protein n=1 Tax=unclassified Psychrosphaera TaxID=2641570 RepID=UPI001C082051|nr:MULTISPECIES: TonB family protein [unclassified Psychrosphaera]MBU2880660.1 TonB family protein [Psychrosphaera sp. I2R16]MBU2990746.1 TonB family protein [Psychrosphaera sp. B3R10]